jgi:hypothetical protein
MKFVAKNSVFHVLHIDLHLQLQIDRLTGSDIDDLCNGHKAGRGGKEVV